MICLIFKFFFFSNKNNLLLIKNENNYIYFRIKKMKIKKIAIRIWDLRAFIGGGLFSNNIKFFKIKSYSRYL